MFLRESIAANSHEGKFLFRLGRNTMHCGWVDVCRSIDKPHLIIDLADGGNLTASVQATREWIAANLAGGILNVAGPRASEHPTIYEQTRAFLWAVLGSSEG